MTHDVFADTQVAANDAQGHAATPKQASAGNYTKGLLKLSGLPIAIEHKANSYRTGIDSSGTRWQSRMAAHYGYIKGTKGNDGDAIDCFVGNFPESEKVYIVNQFVLGTFDEHKVMLGFVDQKDAVSGYTYSFSANWGGLHSIIPCTYSQLKWWLKFGDVTRPVLIENLPFDGNNEGYRMAELAIFDWAQQNAAAQNMYRLRIADDGGELLEAATLDDVMDSIVDDGGEFTATFDALVIEAGQIEKKAQQLGLALSRSAESVSLAENGVTVTKPFKQSGSTQIAMMFEMTDGQTITVFMHNPDVNPNKIAPNDEMVSWKWLLNRKDITIVVAKEGGKDLSLPTVATRIMALVEKNTARFTKANAARQTRMDGITQLEAQVAEREDALRSLVEQIEAKKNTPPAVEPLVSQAVELPINTPIVLTGKELGDFDTSTSEGKKAMRSALKEHLMAMRGDFVDCPVLGDKIMIDKSGIKETLAFTGNPIKMQALYSIKDLIRTAKSVAEEPNFKKSDKPDVIGYLRLKNSIQINGADVSVDVVVERWADGHYQYDMMIEETKAAFDSSNTANVQQVASNYNSETDWVNQIKPQSNTGVNAIFDAATGKMVLNLFLQIKDPVTGEWVDLPDEEGQGIDSHDEEPISPTEPLTLSQLEAVTQIGRDTKKSLDNEAAQHGGTIVWGLLGDGNVGIHRVSGSLFSAGKIELAEILLNLETGECSLQKHGFAIGSIKEAFERAGIDYKSAEDVPLDVGATDTSAASAVKIRDAVGYLKKNYFEGKANGVVISSEDGTYFKAVNNNKQSIVRAKNEVERSHGGWKAFYADDSLSSNYAAAKVIEEFGVRVDRSDPKDFVPGGLKVGDVYNMRADGSHITAAEIQGFGGLLMGKDEPIVSLSSGHTGYNYLLSDFKKRIESGEFKKLDGSLNDFESKEELFSLYVNSKGNEVMRITKSTPYDGAVSYSIKTSSRSGGSETYESAKSTVVREKGYSPSMKLKSGHDFLSPNSVDPDLVNSTKGAAAAAAPQEADAAYLQSIIDNKVDMSTDTFSDELTAAYERVKGDGAALKLANDAITAYMTHMQKQFKSNGFA